MTLGYIDWTGSFSGVKLGVCFNTIFFLFSFILSQRYEVM